MVILTKTKARDTRPRCEARTTAANRCQMHGTAYRDLGLLSICVCGKHDHDKVRYYKDTRP